MDASLVHRCVSRRLHSVTLSVVEKIVFPQRPRGGITYCHIPGTGIFIPGMFFFADPFYYSRSSFSFSLSRRDLDLVQGR